MPYLVAINDVIVILKKPLTEILASLECCECTGKDTCSPSILLLELQAKPALGNHL